MSRSSRRKWQSKSKSKSKSKSVSKSMSKSLEEPPDLEEQILIRPGPALLAAIRELGPGEGG